MDSTFRTLDDLPLISKADCIARLRSHVIPNGYGKRGRAEVMQTDIAKWCGCSYVHLRLIGLGNRDVSDRLQVRLTQLYHLLDAKFIELLIVGGKRSLVRADPRRPIPIPPVKTRAKLDFTGGALKMVMV